MVVEADESDGSFLHISPTIAVVTNIDPEHLDHWKTEEALRQGFVSFVNRVPFYGLAILCIDHPTVQGLLPEVGKRYVTYGESHQADYRAERIEVSGHAVHFDASRRGEPLGRFEMAMVGRHNALNALAVIALADELEHRPGDHPGRLQGVPGRAAPLHGPGRGRRRHRGGRLRPPPGRGAGHAARRPRGLRPARGLRLPAPPLHPHPRPARRVRHRLQRRRRAAAHRHLRRRRGPAPGRDRRAAGGGGARLRPPRRPPPAARRPGRRGRGPAAAGRHRHHAGRRRRDPGRPRAARRCWARDADWRDEIARRVRGECRPDEPLAPRTSIRVGGPADLLVRPADPADLAALLAAVRELGAPALGAGRRRQHPGGRRRGPRRGGAPPRRLRRGARRGRAAAPLGRRPHRAGWRRAATPSAWWAPSSAPASPARWAAPPP